MQHKPNNMILALSVCSPNNIVIGHSNTHISRDSGFLKSKVKVTSFFLFSLINLSSQKTLRFWDRQFHFIIASSFMLCFPQKHVLRCLCVWGSWVCEFCTTSGCWSRCVDVVPNYERWHCVTAVIYTVLSKWREVAEDEVVVTNSADTLIFYIFFVITTHF